MADDDKAEDDIAELEGWVSVFKAAELFGLSKQGSFKALKNEFNRKDIRQIKPQGLQVLRLSAVKAMIKLREEQAAAQEKINAEIEAARAERKLKQAIRVWARQQGYVVRNDYPIPDELVTAYHKAHRTPARPRKRR